MNIMSKMENKIYVIYLGIAGVRSADIEEFKSQIIGRIIPESVEGEFIVIPTESNETRLVCINPLYITEEKLIEEHTTQMIELNQLLSIEVEELKKKNGKEN